MPEALSPAADGMRAIFPLHPRFAPRVDICIVVHDGELGFVARDILEALGLEDAHYAAEPSHEPPCSFQQHATATTWSRQMVGDILSPLAERPDVAGLLRWLDGHIAYLNSLGLETVERTSLYGAGHRTAPTPEPAPKVSPLEDEPAAPSLPAVYSIASAARVLSRDQSIGKLGRDALFEYLHKAGWIRREGGVWQPQRDLTLIGYLAQQNVAVPAHQTLYPQVCITPLGIEALHQKLGGTSPIDFNPNDTPTRHPTLVEE